MFVDMGIGSSTGSRCRRRHDIPYRDEIEQATTADGAAAMTVHYVDPPRAARERWLHMTGYRV